MKKRNILAFVMVAVMILGLCACSSDTTESVVSATEETTVEEVTEVAPVSTEPVVVNFDDYDAMYALSKDIQNGAMDGQTVEIEGTSKKIGSGYSIGQQKESEFIGTSYTYSAEYPADGAHVKFTGTVVGSGLIHTLEATAIEVVE